MHARHVNLCLKRDLDEWNIAEEPVRGSREKMTLIRPTDAAHFIFKFPKHQREHQIWSEIVASFIAGDLLGWEVQRSGIGIWEGQPGSLLDYVYRPGHRDDQQEMFIEGEDLCTEVMPTFDRLRGDDHTLAVLDRIYENILGPRDEMNRASFYDFWARAIAFDTLISNTDRHAGNWAVIRSKGETRMAPLYDNATSMGCNMEARGLNRQFASDGHVDPAKLASFAESGRHHLRAGRSAAKGTPFEDLCRAFLNVHPDGLHRFEAVADLNLDAVETLLAKLGQVELDEPYALCERRRAHMIATLTIGKERIMNISRSRSGR